VCITHSDGQAQQISFVNGIATTKGGTHVLYVADQYALLAVDERPVRHSQGASQHTCLHYRVVAKIMEVVNKKNKAAPVKPFQVRNHVCVHHGPPAEEGGVLSAVRLGLRF
jgi:DNA topoisomerase-2